MSDRYISLYFASIDTKRAAVLFFSWIGAPFGSPTARRATLARAVRERLGAADVFAYASARGALAAYLASMGIGRGDSVLLSSFTCLAVPTAVLAVGATPEYVDVTPHTLNTSPGAMIEAMHHGVKAVVVQHTLGCAADTQAIVAAARARGIVVIEDCALAVGSTVEGLPLGLQGDAAIFSMELSKTISCGWGGVLAVRDAAHSKKVAAHYDRLREPPLLDTARRVLQTVVSGICFTNRILPLGRYVVAAAFRLGLFKPSTPACELIGRPAPDFISRLSGTQAKLASAQWRRLPHVAARAASVAERLREGLEAEGLTVVATPPAGQISVTPRIAFLVRDRAKATRWFAANAVELGNWFDGPLSPLPEPAVFNYYVERYPYAARVARHIVNLASHCRLTDADVDRLLAAIARYAAAHPDDRGFAVASNH